MRWLCAFSVLLFSLEAQTIRTPEYTVSATKNDLTVSQERGPVFSFRSALDTAFRAYAAESWDRPEGCCYEHEFDALSIAGPLLSVRDRFYAGCPNTAHPTTAVRLATLNLSASGGIGFGANAEDAMLASTGAKGRLVSLTSLYSAQELLNALLSDPLLKPYLRQRPPSLEAIPGALPEEGISVKGTPCRFKLSPDYLTRFAFHHAEGNKVAARVGLQPIGGACSSATAELGLLLDWPVTVPPPSRTLVLPKAGEKVRTRIAFCAGNGRKQ